MLRRTWVRTLVLALVGVVVAAQVSAAELVFRVERVTGDLWAKGWIETSTGFKFPDGSTMTTAAVGNGNGWSLTGNAITAGQFLGTTNNQALNIRVNNVRALRIEPHATSPNIIGGYYGNTVGTGVYGATISGGGEVDMVNRVTDNFGTVGGGYSNQAGDAAGTASDAHFATVSGGVLNTASGPWSTVGGGASNTASNECGTVGGGFSNIASGPYTAVGGGQGNQASGQWATVAGGWDNRAMGDYSPTVGGGAKNTASGTDSTVGGGVENTASGDLTTVSGGGENTASGYQATVSGGFNNEASHTLATVGGGSGNRASAWGATVAGGGVSYANGDSATVGGGWNNTASGFYATVGGGQGNRASGSWSTVGGGDYNTAAGDYSFVVGRRAKNTNPAHDGVFMFADSHWADFSSTAANQFNVRASGGYRLFSNAGLTAGVTMAPGSSSWSSVSDRNVKANFAGVDTVQLLDALAGMPVSTWNLQAQSEEIRHIGPMAQDFNASFGYLFGEVESELHINTMDAVGVSLAASQGLYRLVQEQAGEITQLTEEVAQLTAENAQQTGQIAQQAEEIEDLRARLEALEKLVQEGK